jgi:hypothetical protein
VFYIVEGIPYVINGDFSVEAFYIILLETSLYACFRVDKEQRKTNAKEIAPFVLTLSMLLIFTCVSQVTIPKQADESDWTVKRFHEQFANNALSDKYLYINGARIRAGLVSDMGNHYSPTSYQEGTLLYWFYNKFVDSRYLTYLLHKNLPQRDSVLVLYESFYDDYMFASEPSEMNCYRRPWHVVQQSINITDLSDDTAAIEIHETYTAPYSTLEVVYRFTLPENCVLTGVWLQEIEAQATPNKEKGHKYQVSPRGAAQRVYDKLKVRRVDPALLEQVGPMQYRLKVYPIPVGKVMHMWMTYEFIKSQSGDIPLPTLLDNFPQSEQNQTTVIFNGDKSVMTSYQGWMPNLSIKLPRKSDPQSCAIMIYNERVVFPTGPKYFNADTTKVAVVVDSSYSMRVSEDAVLESIEKLQRKFKHVDIFSARRRVTQCSPTKCQPDSTTYTRVQTPVSKNDLIFLGSTNYDELVTSSAHLNASYNIVVLLTDEGTIDSRANKQPGPMSGDLWLVHLTQQYPTRYQDFVTETLFINNAKMALSVDDILSFYVPGNDIHESDMKRCNESLTKFAAKKFMQKYLRENVSTVNHKGELLVPLEKVHEIAVKHSIVTPYSSMIVLINRQQRDMLEMEESQDNKFERKPEWNWRSLLYSSSSTIQRSFPIMFALLVLLQLQIRPI